MSCFNPCFSGFTSTTGASEQPTAHTTQFQSLFFWIHFYDFTIETAVDILAPMFQSLFFWIHFYDRPATTSSRYRRYVSILVFLDSLLRPRSCVCRGANPTGFNPCFSGFTSTTPIYSLSIRWQQRFNPCFSGFTSTTTT